MTLKDFRFNGSVYTRGHGHAKGFAGSMFLVTYPDGSEVVTDNLWLAWDQDAETRLDLPEAKLQTIGLQEFRERKAAQAPEFERGPDGRPWRDPVLPVLIPGFGRSVAR